jgi:hypothetical protein
MNRYLTVKEVANQLEYSPRQILKMLKIDAIPHIKLKKQRYRIPAKWLEDILNKYPSEKEYKEAKEDIRFDADLLQPEIKVNEVKEDMTKNKDVELTNTEIVTNKPKTREFIPNPNKRKKKITKEVKDSDNEEYLDNNEPDNFMDDNDNDNNDQGFLDDYRGIGNY